MAVHFFSSELIANLQFDKLFHCQSCQDMSLDEKAKTPGMTNFTILLMTSYLASLDLGRFLFQRFFNLQSRAILTLCL
jgi:hypothetical protein